MWARTASRILAAGLAAGLAGCGMVMRGTVPPDKAALYQSALKAPEARRFHEAVLDASEGRYARADQAFRALADLAAARDDARRAAEALFWAGYCQEKLGRRAPAAATYREVLRAYPDQPAAEQAQWRLSRLRQADQSP